MAEYYYRERKRESGEALSLNRAEVEIISWLKLARYMGI